MLRTLKELPATVQPAPPAAGTRAAEHALQLANAIMLICEFHAIGHHCTGSRTTFQRDGGQRRRERAT